MLELILTNNRAFPWQRAGNVWAKGYVFAPDGRQFADADLPEYFAGIETEWDFVRRVREANGSFCVIVKTAAGYQVAVDRLRSMLMFVAEHNGEILIGDDANVLREKLQIDQSDLDELKVEELRQSGYTVGSHTIYKSIAQLQGGEYAVVMDKDFSIRYYYEHTHGNFMEVSKDEAFRRLDGISERMFRRLVDSVGGRQIVVPLSGGYDSRYIVAWLKKLRYENVYCFTYGRSDSFEVQISQQVAEKLDYKWHFVEYTDETWQSIFTDEWREFYGYSGQLSQLPHVQDIYAIKTLLEQGIIHKDSVVVPGYCGDVLGGSFLVDDELTVDISKRGLAKSIRASHFNFMKKSDLTEAVITDIQNSISDSVATLDSFNGAMEKWLTTHRWSKFIVNALRGYDYFGLEWRMPLWDNELMEFWYRVPNEHRGKNTWYDEYLLNGIFKEYGIDFIKKNAVIGNNEVFSVLRKIKNSMKKVLPIPMVDALQRFVFKKENDFNHFSSIITKLKTGEPQLIGVEEMVDSQNVNAILVLRYLQVILKI